MNADLQKLQVLTEEVKKAVPRLSAVVKTDLGSLVEYDVANGECFSLSLYSCAEISVNRCFFSGGVRFPSHAHDETEWFILYKGRVIISVEGRSDVELRPGDSLVVPPGVKHSAIVPENSWMLIAAVPASEGFASGRE